MVLQGGPCGRVGRRRTNIQRARSPNFGSGTRLFFVVASLGVHVCGLDPQHPAGMGTAAHAQGRRVGRRSVTRSSCRPSGTCEVAEAVTLAGALPVFADIDPVTYCLDAGRCRGRHHSADGGRRCRAPLRAAGRHGAAATSVGQRHGLLVLRARASPRRRTTRSPGAGQRAAYLDSAVDAGRAYARRRRRAHSTSSTSCGCRATGGRTGTPSPGPAGQGSRVPGAGEDAGAPAARVPVGAVAAARPSGPPTRRWRCRWTPR